jgi:hypothetical protein
MVTEVAMEGETGKDYLWHQKDGATTLSKTALSKTTLSITKLTLTTIILTM